MTIAPTSLRIPELVCAALDLKLRSQLQVSDVQCLGARAYAPLGQPRGYDAGRELQRVSRLGPEIPVDTGHPSVRLELSTQQASPGVAQEGLRMRYVILVCLLGLALALDLTVLIATSDDSSEAFDLRHPATLVPIVAHRVHTVSTAAGEFVRDLVEWVAAPYRERLQRTLPTDAPPQ